MSQAQTDSFLSDLKNARDERHSKDHPFIDKWAKGELTKKQTAVYVVQHYHFVTDYLNWLAFIWANCPIKEVKDSILENLKEEEDPEDRHLEMLVDYAKACGLTREEVVNGKVLAWTQALKDWGWRFVYQNPWQVSCAGLMIGLESQPPHIYPRIIPALHDLYGWKPDDHEIRFFRGHVAADEIHSARGFQMTERYCNTPELRAAAIEAVRVAAQKRWNHMTGIYSYAVHGKDEPTPEP
ncbi:MAG TPA: iron-containing redox enzyme family protein [Blastocatellia bacterium]|nr:iron-containing redox enzyme family protein [Blastocatellia bacterium]